MGKLLHERLRNVQIDKSGNARTFNQQVVVLESEFGIQRSDLFRYIAYKIDKTYISLEKYESEINSIIDAQQESAHHIIKVWAEEHDMPIKDGESITHWLKRWTIFRPRFEDGEPVQFGDEVEWCDGKLNSLLLFDDGSGQAYGINDDWVRQPLDGCELHPKKALKRPTPKAYDADGVEIKVGDTVYSVYNGNPMTVEKVRKNDKQLCGKDSVCCGGGIFFPATNFTNERPVFDAEGVRYTKGQTVWSLSGVEYIVDEVIDDDHICVRRPDSEKAHATFTSRTLTHREPDSLEKLRDDVFSLMIENEFKATAHEIKDRFTAIIERGA